MKNKFRKLLKDFGYQIRHIEKYRLLEAGREGLYEIIGDGKEFFLRNLGNKIIYQIDIPDNNKNYFKGFHRVSCYEIEFIFEKYRAQEESKMLKNIYSVSKKSTGVKTL